MIQFDAAFKKLLIGACFKSQNGNAIQQDDTRLLNLPSETNKAIELIENVYELGNEDKIEIYLNAMSNNSQVVKSTIPYISGFINSRILRKEGCIHCYEFMKNTTLRHWC